jgi:hypothetical protein
MDLYPIEQRVLGAIIARPETASKTLSMVPPEEWSGPHLLIAEAVQTLVDQAEPITTTTVMTLMSRLGTLRRCGGGAVLLALDEARAAPGEDEYLVDILEGEMLRRHGRAVATRLSQRLDNPETNPDEAFYAAKEELDRIRTGQAAVETHSWPEGDFDPVPDWIIPGLVAVDERIMLTGGEGLGKTMLIRQLVCSVAVGRHPWSFEPFEPAAALHIDLENPRSVSDSAYRHIRNGLRFAHVPVGHLLHRIEPKIFNVENPHDVSWLLRIVRSVKPRIIAIGPLKNMSSEDLNDEHNAVRVHNVLNRIRAESDAALLVEAHAGHGSRGEGGDWRPRGSSSFLGWPEAGLGMKPLPDTGVRAAQLVPWRLPRAMGRAWPQWLAAGTPWPWVEDPRREAS